MSSFLVDENLPHSLASDLVSQGHAAVHIRDAGLVGHPDSDIFEYAISNHLTIIACDLDFADVRRYSAERHNGIIILRLPDEIGIERRRRLLFRALSQIDDSEFAGTLIILDLAGIRVRKGRR